MTDRIAVIAAGAMGSGVGRRLTEGGAQVLTVLEGRSPASVARAQAAGMQPGSLADVAGCGLILSIVPPAEAVGLAEHLAPALKAANAKPIYVDCNAIDVRTVRQVEAAIAPTGAAFLDGGIIGGPPKPGVAGPTLYLAGQQAGPVVQTLGRLGLKSRVAEGDIGAASALKMSYAGISKGVTALAALMILGATKAGAADALLDELQASQPQLAKRFSTGLPDMVPKAYRWVAEMREIAAFLDDPAAASVFEGFAQLYDRLAKDAAGPGAETGVLTAFAARLMP